MRKNLCGMCLAFALLTVFSLGCLKSGGIVSTCGAPTKKEIKDALTKRTRSIYLTETNKNLYKIKDVELDFDDSSIKIGSSVEKQVEFGASGKQEYPVRVSYTITTIYSSGVESKVEEIGDEIGEYFYREGFGEWKARYGGDN